MVVLDVKSVFCVFGHGAGYTCICVYLFACDATYTLYSRLLALLAPTLLRVLQRLQRSVRQPAQRLGHDLVLGLAGGNGAPPGAVGVGVCHWRHGRVGCQASAATSAGLGSSGTCRGGVTNSEEQLCIWLCIWCVFASKTKTHRYTRICTPHPLYFPPGLPVVTASKTHITLTLRGPPTPARRGARWRCSCSS